MPKLLPEPQYRHGTADKTAILLVNLGTPEAPTAPALRRYLKQFLSDPRVVEIPRLVWWPILNGIILNIRPKKSAEKYASIWTPAGSPLKVHTEQQALLLKSELQQRLGIGNEQLLVDWAMRYGSPSIGEQLSQLKAAGAKRILLLPLYPQYAGSTTATAVDVAADWLIHTRNQPELRYCRSFPDHPGYIAALAASVREHWANHGRPDKLLMSFHGVPRATLERGDPYHCECQKTGRLLAQALGLAEHEWLLTFQSRFGKAQWLQPYTAPTLERLAEEGVRRVDVICPGFTGDCLETLEEIALEGKASFLAAGGAEYHYLPCLNERGDWIAALADIAIANMAGWQPEIAPDPSALAHSASRALKLGAQQ
jgi:ferrochelatase